MEKTDFQCRCCHDKPATIDGLCQDCCEMFDAYLSIDHEKLCVHNDQIVGNVLRVAYPWRLIAQAKA